MNLSGEQSAKSAPDVLPFLQKDYEMKVNYLSAHFTRMWTRFNFFLTLESALSAAFWLWIKEASGSLPKITIASGQGLVWIGLVSSVVWYLFGAQDRYLVVLYRRQVQAAGDEVARRLGLSNLSYVGDPEEKVSRDISQWRANAISVTRLAALFPLLVIIYWLTVIVRFYW